MYDRPESSGAGDDRPWVQPPLPLLQLGATPLEQRLPMRVPTDRIPVATLSLHDCDGCYSFRASVLARAIRSDLLACHGNPLSYHDCFVDLESAARVATLTSRGSKLDWTHTDLSGRIRDPSGDEPDLRRLLGRFLVGHAKLRSHVPGIVGYRAAYSGFDPGPFTHGYSGWTDVMAYGQCCTPALLRR